ncbi:MAG: hypothetical protein WBG92_23305 [Thiohalocapsa sp.]
MAASNSTRAFLRSLIRDVRAEVRYLTPGDNGQRPRVADLLIRAERDLLALAPRLEG